MQNKSTINHNNLQELPAGMQPNDANIEFVGQRDTKEIIWFQYGKAHTWAELPKNLYDNCEELFLTDIEAVKTLPNYYKESADDVNRLTELYIYHMYGGCDQNPDMVEGILQPCENFRDNKDCLSLEFDKKFIDIEGIHLSQRDLKIIDMCVDNIADKVIADALGISQSTFDFHKKNLFNKLGCDSKVSLVVKSIKNHILCES